MINIPISADWTPEQALATYELLDEMREQIWQWYGEDIQALLKQQQAEWQQPDDDIDF